MNKTEKQRRQAIMRQIDQEADCSGHNRPMRQSYRDSFPNFGFEGLAMLAGMIGRAKRKGGRP